MRDDSVQKRVDWRVFARSCSQGRVFERGRVVVDVTYDDVDLKQANNAIPQ